MASDDCFITPVSSTEDLLSLVETNIGYETASDSMLTYGAAHSIHTSSAGSVTSKYAIEKPTQVVSSVVSTEVSKFIPSFTAPMPALVRSVSATQVCPETLINLSSSKPPIASQDINHEQSLRVILQNQDKELTSLRHENKELRCTLQKDGQIQQELCNTIKKLESDVQNLSQKKENLMQQNRDKALRNKKMVKVMKEYEKILDTLISKQEKLIADKEEALNHLANMESSFNDLLSNYEKSKAVINNLEKGQKVMQKILLENEAGKKMCEEFINKLKDVTSDNLKITNEILEKINK